MRERGSSLSYLKQGIIFAIAHGDSGDVRFGALSGLKSDIARGPKSAKPGSVGSFDDQIDARQENWRKGQSDGFCGFQING
jgi:hypothetical protein